MILVGKMGVFITFPFFILFYRLLTKGIFKPLCEESFPPKRRSRDFSTSTLFLVISTVGFLLPSNLGFAKSDLDHSGKKDCSSILIQKDFENHYKKTREKLEEGLNQGLAKKLSDELMSINRNIDRLSLQVFDMNTDNSQEVNLLVQKTIDQLEKIIRLIPEISILAPKIRKQYVMPFTDMNSMGAEYQNCLMELAIEEIQSQDRDIKIKNSGSIYKKLTSELNQMNQSLYTSQTFRVEQFIGYHSQLISALEEYNTYNTKGKDQDDKTSVRENISGKIPLILNSVQTEIDKVRPGLQLSKTYYSILN